MAAKDEKAKGGRTHKKETKKRVEAEASHKNIQGNAFSGFSLLAKDSAVDAKLGSLFEVKRQSVPQQQQQPTRSKVSRAEREQSEGSEDEVDDEELSALDSGEEDEQQNDEEAPAIRTVENRGHSKRKRKRGDDVDNLEQAHLQRLVREEEQEAKKAATKRAAKRQRSNVDTTTTSEDLAKDEQASSDNEGVSIDSQTSDEEDEKASPPPQHETLQTPDVEMSKASRTVFLGNVALSTITEKSAKQSLKAHLISFFPQMSTPKDGEPPHKLESIRFRSTPYAASLPKKAAFAKQDIMDATSHATNAYAVYSSQALARNAAKHLNGTTILDRHLRVDEVAHPSQTDHKRCVFIGNLGFVDDERNIQEANAEAGRERTRKPAKTPADIEEGLWRIFSRCGSVESVRVIRDSKTRVGIGIAYVQFHDENAVEAALLYEGKKFPPMLPRNLRVSRAKAMKRNAKPGSGRPGAPRPMTRPNGYARKITSEEASRLGRTGKLFGKAAALAQEKNQRTQGMVSKGRKTRPNPAPPRQGGEERLRRPESFVFEGHRATSKSGTGGLKLGRKNKVGPKGKPSNRSTKRAAAYRASGKGTK